MRHRPDVPHTDGQDPVEVHRCVPRPDVPDCQDPSIVDRHICLRTMSIVFPRAELSFPGLHPVMLSLLGERNYARLLLEIKRLTSHLRTHLVLTRVESGYLGDKAPDLLENLQAEREFSQQVSVRMYRRSWRSMIKRALGVRRSERRDQT